MFSSICVNIVLFLTHKGVTKSNDVREECLECQITSNDVIEEYYIIVMIGRCVNTVKSLNSGHHWFSETVSAIERCPL